jgi:hypothetical protein
MAKQCACGCGETLKPGSPWNVKRGHASRAVDNYVDKASSKTPDKQLRNADGKRVCACGCGTPLVNRHPYIKGHDKRAGDTRNDDPRPQQTNGVKPEIQIHQLPPVGLLNGNGRNHKVLCSVSELAMDRIWAKLDAEEKAQLLFPTETQPASEALHAASEPAHA